MKNIVLVLAVVGLLVGCGTVPLPKTAACLQKAEDMFATELYANVDGEVVQLYEKEKQELLQMARNECWWAKGDRKN